MLEDEFYSLPLGSHWCFTTNFALTLKPVLFSIFATLLLCRKPARISTCFEQNMRIKDSSSAEGVEQYTRTCRTWHTPTLISKENLLFLGSSREPTFWDPKSIKFWWKCSERFKIGCARRNRVPCWWKRAASACVALTQVPQLHLRPKTTSRLTCDSEIACRCECECCQSVFFSVLIY